MKNRSFCLLVVTLCTILTQWGCQPTRDMLVEPGPGSQPITIDEARSWYNSRAAGVRRGGKNDDELVLWQYARSGKLANGTAVVSVPVFYDYVAPVIIPDNENFVRRAQQAPQLSINAKEYRIQKKRLISRDGEGKIRVVTLLVIPSRQSQRKKEAIKKERFTGTVLAMNGDETTYETGWKYKNGKLVAIIQPPKGSANGRGSHECQVGVYQKMAQDPNPKGGGGNSHCVSGADRHCLPQNYQDDTGGWWVIISTLTGQCEDDEVYGQPKFQNEQGQDISNWVWAGAGLGSNGGGSNTGNNIPYWGQDPFTPNEIDEGPPIDISPGQLFVWEMEHQVGNTFSLSPDEKVYIEENPRLWPIIRTYMYNFSGKPDVRNVVKLVCEYFASSNPYAETEEQLAARILKTLGLTDYSQLEQAPFSTPDVGILTGLLHAQKVSREAAVLKLMHPDWGQARCLITAVLNVSLGTVHFVLDAFGLIPGAGELADGINGGIYLLEGDNTSAGLSFAAMMPIGGWAATGGKWARNALKYDGAGGWVSKNGLTFSFLGKENRLDHVFNHIKDDLSKGSHGIFSTSSRKEVLSLVDEAWEKVQRENISYTINPRNGAYNYVVDMGRTVGREGGNLGSGEDLSKMLISTKPNSDAVLITAFPTR